MQASAVIGRVGGLAVALGIGAGMLLIGADPAQAAPADSSPTQSDSTTSATAVGTRGTRPARQAPPPAATADRAARRATVGAPRNDNAPAPVASAAARVALPTAPASNSRAPEPAVALRSAAVDAVAATDPDPEAVVVQTFSPKFVTTAPDVVMPAAAQAPVMTAAATAAMESVPSPGLGTGYGTELDSPVSWAVLAVARRQIGRVALVSPAAAVASTAQPVRAAAVANQAPLISGVALGTPNATSGAVTGTVTAADPNGDKITYKATATKGTVSITTAGVFTYTPTAAARHAAAKAGATTSTTTDTVTVTVTDAKGAATSAPVTVAILPKNVVPVATKTVGTPNASTGVVTGSVTATDADRDVPAYSGSTTTTKGTVAVNAATGAFTYTPTTAARHAAARVGATTAATTDAFTVTVSDGYGGTVAVPVTVAVSPKNAAPVAGTTTKGAPDASTGAVAGSVAISDADSDVLTYAGSTTTSKGTVAVNAATGGFTYTPTATARHAAARVGATTAATTDAFTVTASDGYGGTVAVPVTVTVSPKNTAPTAGTPTVGTPNAATGAVTGTVGVSDADKDVLTYSGSTTTAKGTVTVNAATGGFTYTPTATARHAAAKVGATTAATTDAFTVTVTDGYGATVAVPVTVAVSPTNAAPVAGTTTKGAPNASTGAVAGAVVVSDTDKDVLTYSGSTTTAKATVVVNAATGAFTYTPTATARHAAAKVGATSATATDAFAVTVTDGYGGTVTVPVTVTLSPKNTAPTAGTPTVGTPDASTGVVTGTVGATDVEADTLTYSAPTTTAKGTVSVNAGTGAFTYTPTARTNVAGTDTFTVTVTDGYGGSTPVAVSVPVTATATPPVTSPKVSVVFNYGTGSQYWTTAAKTALQSSADAVAAYIVVSSPVTLVFDVTAEKTSSWTMASTGSDLTSGGSGFFSTVVQNKVLTGLDANGAAADGSIDVNFGLPWAYGDSVTASQYDFKSTMMHEILHAYGFLAYVDQPGYNTGTSWTKFDSFIQTKSGTRVISSGTYRFNTAYNTNLTGGGGGLFFGGPNAIAAYGGPVPLYTPNPWQAGSSVSHLDDKTFTGAAEKLMNATVSTGLGLRTLSAVEIGILKDLGYTVTSNPVAGGLLLFGVVFLRRRTRR